MGGLNSKQIADIKKGKTDVLTITNQRKDHLHKKIYTLTTTQTWNISNNFLSSLSPKIAALNLTSLNLSSNDFAEFPKEICSIVSLTHLDFSFNFVGSLPSDIHQLINLTDLDLSFNKITFLPSELGKISALQKITITNNNLEKIPETCLSLPNLLHLNLAHNNITVFPSKTSWPKLEELILAGNHLIQLPPNILSIPALRTLSLARNHIISFPPANTTPNPNSKLAKLYLNNNHLKDLTPAIYHFIHLEVLILKSNDLKSIPNDLFVHIPKLKHLDIAFNADLKWGLTMPNTFTDLLVREIHLQKSQRTEEKLPTDVQSSPSSSPTTRAGKDSASKDSPSPSPAPTLTPSPALPPNGTPAPSSTHAPNGKHASTSLDTLSSTSSTSTSTTTSSPRKSVKVGASPSVTSTKPSTTATTTPSLSSTTTNTKPSTTATTTTATTTPSLSLSTADSPPNGKQAVAAPNGDGAPSEEPKRKHTKHVKKYVKDQKRIRVVEHDYSITNKNLNSHATHLAELAVWSGNQDCDVEDEIRKVLLDITPIRPGLFLSSKYGALDRDALHSKGITHILVVGSELSPNFPDEFEYHSIRVKDNSITDDLSLFFPMCQKFIETGRKKGGVLVHCAAGVSRSASVVMAYMMWSENISFAQARKELKSLRPIVKSNFYLQLEYYNSLLRAQSKKKAKQKKPKRPKLVRTTSLPTTEVLHKIKMDSFIAEPSALLASPALTLSASSAAPSPSDTALPPHPNPFNTISKGSNGLGKKFGTMNVLPGSRSPKLAKSATAPNTPTAAMKERRDKEKEKEKEKEKDKDDTIPESLMAEVSDFEELSEIHKLMRVHSLPDLHATVRKGTGKSFLKVSKITPT